MRETRDSKGRVRLDEKHSLEIYREWGVEFGEPNEYTPRIVKSTNDQPIPDEEPRILFRGRDILAVQMLEYYRDLCIMDEATDFQLKSINKMIEEFKEFAKNSPTMKQPGSTSGK